MFDTIKKRISDKVWNIGFIKGNPEDLISNKLDIGNAIWLRHDFKHHCFADPFILSVSDTTIDILAEDILLGSKNIASLCKLTVSLTTGKVLEKKTILEGHVHYSYPNIIRDNDQIYVFPENSVLSTQNVYIYDMQTEKCRLEKSVLPVSVADATICKGSDGYYLFATSRKAYNTDLYLWKSQCLFSGYEEAGVLIKSELRGSRMAGNIFEVGNSLYRPSQDCINDYGKGVILYRIEDLSIETYHETEVLTIYPTKNSIYNEGLHTINFYEGICVIDGYQYKNSLYDKIKRRLFGKYRV